MENAKTGEIVRKTLTYMLQTAWQEKPTLILLYGLRLFAQCMQKVQIIILPKLLIDELMLLVSTTSSKIHLQKVISYVILICGTNLIANILSNISFQKCSVIQTWFDLYFEKMLAQKAMEMDFAHTEEPEVLDQLNRAKEGITWYSGGVVGILNHVYDMILYVMVLAGVSTILLFTCPFLLPIQFLALVLMAQFNACKNRHEIENYGKLAKSNRIFGYFMFQLSDFRYGKEIRLYDSAGMMLNKAEIIAKEQIDTWSSLSSKQRTLDWGMNIVNAVRDGLSYFYIGLLALTGKITVGDFAMCVAGASELYHGMNGLILGRQEIVKRCNYAYKFIKFMEYPSSMSQGTCHVAEEKHTIEFVHVSFRYPRTEQMILEDVNLKISSGEHISIVGLNGAGKTTFIKLLCRLYDVTEGEILIDGINIKEYEEEEYRRLFAIVFQDFKLFAFTLRENISLDKGTDDEDIWRVLELAGLAEDARKLPMSLDTMIYKSFDEHGTELSGGQQQKTAISRALYRNAPIVILDEPTAALDPMAEYDIYKRFDCLVGNKTAIYISHRLSSCKFCDRIAVFADKTIKEYGTHDELICIRDGIYATLFHAQAKYYQEN